MTKLIIILFITFAVGTAAAVDVANSRGNLIQTVEFKHKQPVIVVDTLQLSDGKGTLRFNVSKSNALVDVSGSSQRKVFAVAQQILPDTLTNINYYGIITYPSGDSVTVLSSDPNDESLVAMIVINY